MRICENAYKAGYKKIQRCDGESLAAPDKEKKLYGGGSKKYHLTIEFWCDPDLNLIKTAGREGVGLYHGSDLGWEDIPYRHMDDEVFLEMAAITIDRKWDINVDPETER